jgi:hypothetical protein
MAKMSSRKKFERVRSFTMRVTRVGFWSRKSTV